jgi:hypothetical protein
LNYTNLLQGYKEYKTERVYMARMGDWRDNKDIEIPLDGVGGVSIVVKADVHREGSQSVHCFALRSVRGEMLTSHRH